MLAGELLELILIQVAVNHWAHLRPFRECLKIRLFWCRGSALSYFEPI